MDSVFIISDRVKKPFMVVISRAKGTEFKPLTSDAKNLSRYLIDEYKNQPITKGELSQVIDENMDIQGPSPLNSATKKKIERLIAESELPKYPKGTSPPKNDTLLKAKSAHVVKHLPVLSISEVAISEFSTMEHRNVIQYKAACFVSDQTKTTFNYEVKRVRAMWDPSLSIPGTDRRGGWRCPVGTRYGGQITDRFGRNCGWGVARRIANAITNIGDRLENIDDRRRGRRVERRNNRMIERLRRDERGGRLERGLRGVADVLDGGETSRPTGATRRPRELTPAPEALPSAKRPKPRREEKPETAVKPRPKPRVVTPVEDRKPETSKPTGGSREEKEEKDFLKKILEGHPDGIEGPVWDDWVDITEADEPVIKRLIEKGLLSRKPNDTGTGVGGRAKYQYEVTDKGKKFLRGEDSETPKPVAPRRPRAVPKPKDAPEGSKLTPKEAGDVKANEEFPDYVNRKYNEYAKRVREIREGGGNAGMLRRAEWYAINKDNLRDAWGSANGKVAPESFEPPAPRPRRPRNNRNRRRNASDANAEASASRRPKPEDKPEVAPISPIKPKKRVDKNAPTKDFDHTGVAYRDKASAQDKARQLANRENKDFHVIQYTGNGIDGGADKYYVLDDDQYEKLRGNESLGGKWAGVGLARGQVAQFDPEVPPNKMPSFEARGWREAGFRKFRKGNWVIEPKNGEDGKFQGFIARNENGAGNIEQDYRGPQGPGALNNYLTMIEGILDGIDPFEDEPESVNAPSAPKSGGKLKNLFKRKTKNRSEKSLGEDNELGVNVGVHIPVGENGIKTKEDAVRALKEGASLSEIPDDFIFDALKENSVDVDEVMTREAERYLDEMRADGLLVGQNAASVYLRNGYGQFIFSQILASADLALPDAVQLGLEQLEAQGKLPKYINIKASSIAQPNFFFQLVKMDDGQFALSGEGYILKKEDPWAMLPNLNELIGLEIAQYMGSPQEAGRVDGKIDGRQAIAISLGSNFLEAKQVVGAYSPTEKNALRMTNLMTNFLLGMGDRHEMNALLYRDSDGNDISVPIDFGRLFQWGDDIDRDTLRFYAEDIFEMDPYAGFNRNDIQTVNEIGNDYLNNLKTIDFVDMQNRLKKMWAGKDIDAQDISEQVDTMRKRVEQLIALLENQGLGDALFGRRN